MAKEFRLDHTTIIEKHTQGSRGKIVPSPKPVVLGPRIKNHKKVSPPGWEFTTTLAPKKLSILVQNIMDFAKVVQLTFQDHLIRG